MVLSEEIQGQITGLVDEGTPKTTWRRTVESERTQIGWKNWKEARTAAVDRQKWRSSVKSIYATKREDNRWSEEDEGYSIWAAALDVGCDSKTASKWVNKKRDRGDVKDLPKPGRPRVTSARQDTSIINHAINNRSYVGLWLCIFKSTNYSNWISSLLLNQNWQFFLLTMQYLWMIYNWKLSSTLFKIQTKTASSDSH